MTKPELGTKRVCAGCNAKFYDLMKDPIVCPKCETVFEPPKPEPARPAKRNSNLRSVPKPAEVAGEPVAAAEKAEGDELEVENDDSSKEDEGGVALLENDDEE